MVVLETTVAIAVVTFPVVGSTCILVEVDGERDTEGDRLGVFEIDGDVLGLAP